MAPTEQEKPGEGTPLVVPLVASSSASEVVEDSESACEATGVSLEGRPMEPARAKTARRKIVSGLSMTVGIVGAFALAAIRRDAFAEVASAVSGSVESIESSMVESSSAATESQTTEECLANDDVYIYKYTLASSMATQDGKWTEAFLGCTFMNVTDTSGCAELGKTSCMNENLGFGLHYVHNDVTREGPMSVADWDAIFYEEVDHSFSKNIYSQFFHYHLAFFVPNLSHHVKWLATNGHQFLLRKGYGVYDSELWYTLIVRSPSSKIFEIHSPKLEEWLNPWLNVEDVMQWRHEDECPSSHMSQTYTASELLDQYYDLTDGIASKSALGLPDLLPIRSSIAVSDVAAVKTWFATAVPSLIFNETTALGEPCQFITTRIPYYTTQEYNHEVRFVQNDWAPTVSKSVGDFISYVNEVNANYTSPDAGWSAWYDRHMGLMFKSCPLDKYMLKFKEEDISFHPHGRDSETKNTGEPTDHCWTEGIQGYGIEMQGNFTYEYKDCYPVFDWCTWDTDPVKDVCNDRR